MKFLGRSDFEKNGKPYRQSMKNVHFYVINKQNSLVNIFVLV